MGERWLPIRVKHETLVVDVLPIPEKRIIRAQQDSNSFFSVGGIQVLSISPIMPNPCFNVNCIQELERRSH